MTTNQGLTICAAVAADQHCKGVCVEQGNVCILHFTLPTQPIFLSRSAVTCVYLWFSSRMRVTDRSTTSEVSFPSLHTNARVSVSLLPRVFVTPLNSAWSETTGGPRSTSWLPRVNHRCTSW